MNTLQKNTIVKSAHQLQHRLLEKYSDSATPEAVEANQLAFLLTRGPKAYLTNFGPSPISPVAVRTCLEDLKVTMPSEVGSLIERHNIACRKYSDKQSHMSQNLGFSQA